MESTLTELARSVKIKMMKMELSRAAKVWEGFIIILRETYIIGQ